MPSTTLATAATAPIVTSTSPTASSVIGAQFARSSWAETAIAAAYSNGGRKTKKTTSGSSSGDGSPGTKPIRRPPSTSATGYGTPLRGPSPASTATARRRKMNSSTSATGIIYPARAVFSRRPRAALPTSARDGASGAGFAGGLRDARRPRHRPGGADRPRGAGQRRGARLYGGEGRGRVAIRAGPRGDPLSAAARTPRHAERPGRRHPHVRLADAAGSGLAPRREGAVHVHPACAALAAWAAPGRRSRGSRPRRGRRGDRARAPAADGGRRRPGGGARRLPRPAGRGRGRPQRGPPRRGDHLDPAAPAL